MSIGVCKERGFYWVEYWIEKYIKWFGVIYIFNMLVIIDGLMFDFVIVVMIELFRLLDEVVIIVVLVIDIL